MAGRQQSFESEKSVPIGGVDRGSGHGGQLAPLNFRLSENVLLLCLKFSSKIQNMGVEIAHFGET